MSQESYERERNIHFNRVWDIGPEVLNKILPDMLVIDVRLHEEISGELQGIVGSVSIPLNELKENSKKLSKDRPIVMACRNGWRSARAADILVKLGFTQVYNLKGGLLFWNELLPGSN